MKKANVVSSDCVMVRWNIAFTVGTSGSIIAVMKPQAKKSVVTAMNADCIPAFVSGTSCVSVIAPPLQVATRLASARPGCQRLDPGAHAATQGILSEAEGGYSPSRRSEEHTSE